MIPTNSLPLRIFHQMKLFRQIASIFLALWIVLVSSGFTIHKHFCEGKLQRVAILGEASPCEHAQAVVKESPCPMCKLKQQKTPKNDCCKNEQSRIELEDTPTLAKVFMDSDKHFQFVALIYFIFSELYSDYPAYYKNYLNFKPPLVPRDIPVWVQSFLI